MKNLVAITFIACVMLFTACSNEEDSPVPPKEQQLVLNASAPEAEVGETVNFKVIANGTTVTDALIYINGSLNSQNPSFDEKGSYSIVAKKEGFLDSKPLNLNIYQTDVYAAGFKSNAAKLWKNGEEQDLTDGSNGAYASSVFVSSNDEYVAIVESNSSNIYVAKLWKNGVTQDLTDGLNHAFAKSVFVSDNDVYVAGREQNNSNFYVAKVWKNGVAQDLTDGSNHAYSESVFVSGNDVYVAGRERNDSNIYVAKVWKNGVVQDLTDGLNDAYTESVYVSGNDVYVAGYERNGLKNIAKLWKNGVAQILTDSSSDAYAQSVFVSGNDVYVAGYERNGSKWEAKLWKNGETQDLTDGSNDAFAYSVFVSSSSIDSGQVDVYVAGSENNGSTYIAKLWKNGEAQDLTGGLNPAEAWSVFVVKSYE